MRNRVHIALLLAAVATPAAAQQPQPVDNRIKKLEAEMRAVQRKVFPGAGRAQAILEPEISAAAPATAQVGVPVGSAVADLTARIDALEAQLARLTGQAEEAGFKVRQLEAQLVAVQAAQQAAVVPEPVQAAAPAEAEPQPPEISADPAADIASSADPGEDAYLAGFRLWEQKKFTDAQAALDAMATKYPTHRRASWARNLAGRALLDSGKPAAAAKTLFANYEADPKGERAPDSLYYLGDALVRLKKTDEACKVYSELQNVYGASLSTTLKRDLPRARKTAGCA